MSGEGSHLLRQRTVRVSLVLALLLVLLCVVVWSVTLWPARAAHARLTADIRDLRGEIISAAQRTALQAAVTQATLELAQARLKLQQDLPQSELVARLSGLAAEHGLRLLDQAFEQGRPQGDYLALALDLALEGRYGDMRLFVQALDGLPVWISIVDASLERSRADAGLVRAKLRLVTYRPAGSAIAGAGGRR